MKAKVTVKPELLKWARERASLGVDELARAMGIRNPEKVSEWEKTGELSLAQLNKLAAKTYTPIGYLFLPEPPEEHLPVTDFRRTDNADAVKPSPNLLDTLYSCQLRQEWFRDYLIREGSEPLAFVGSATEKDNPNDVAKRIREEIGLSLEDRPKTGNYEDYLKFMVNKTEDAGILVMRSGVVGNNTHRILDINEFRGFTLSDKYVPLIFVNAADAKAAQMFTLAHELAHVWLGQSGVSKPTFVEDQAIESFCNAVAAEVLVPMEDFEKNWKQDEDISREVDRLAKLYKVSSLVILIRALKAQVIDRSTFSQHYGMRRQAFLDKASTDGGNFYPTQNSRLGNRFAVAVITSALEGKTLYSEAFSLLDLKSSETFYETAKRLGITP